MSMTTDVRSRALLATVALVVGAVGLHVLLSPFASSGFPAIVRGPQLFLRVGAGQEVTGSRIVGLTFHEANDRALPLIRIDGIERVSEFADLVLYHFSEQDPITHTWSPVCAPDGEGSRLGFPWSDAWYSGDDSTGAEKFQIACTSGAIGKCVRFGYAPWKRGPHGESLSEYHASCTRLLRADYCGVGVPHTKDGMMVDVMDEIGVQRVSRHSPRSFEASWGPDGALCIARPRLPMTNATAALQSIMDECPDRWTTSVPAMRDGCMVRARPEHARPFLWNRS
ncbi:hypothetical protein HY632_00290 [Candidatus Uhrbacteria bacterium]|nr:hypothetical protein [Candidatus Uhrbacteria bacterium]